MDTKIHALVDAAGRPIRLMLSPGQDYDGHAALDLLDNLPAGCQAQGAVAVIPSMPQRNPVIPHDKERNQVERFFNKPKNYRAIATRYDNFLASV